MLKPLASGTPSNKIIITRGKDSGHNGYHFLILPGNANAFYVIGQSHIEISYLAFRNQGSNAAVVSVGSIGYLTNDIDILHCTILHPTFLGIAWMGTGRIMYNTILTGNINTQMKRMELI